jgi:hypothetical protein
MNSRSGGQNRIEGVTWERVKDSPLAQRHLARVYAFAPDGSWLIQEKIDSPESRRNRVTHAMERELVQALNDLGIDAEDVWTSNWRDRDGVAVSIDYGYDHILFDGGDRRACGACVHCISTNRSRRE